MTLSQIGFSATIEFNMFPCANVPLKNTLWMLFHCAPPAVGHKENGITAWWTASKSRRREKPACMYLMRVEVMLVGVGGEQTLSDVQHSPLNFIPSDVRYRQSAKASGNLRLQRLKAPVVVQARRKNRRLHFHLEQSRSWVFANNSRFKSLATPKLTIPSCPQQATSHAGPLEDFLFDSNTKHVTLNKKNCLQPVSDLRSQNHA